MYKGPEQYLENDASTGRVLSHARLLLKLSRRFEAIAPSGLRHAAHVANYKSGKIVIHAENGAVAAKIRQMSQRLANELSIGSTECSGIDVKVQPRQMPYQSTSSTTKPLSGKAFRTLQATEKSLPEGPLRAAISHLLERVARQE